jgi:hypothetical protein
MARKCLHEAAGDDNAAKIGPPPSGVAGNFLQGALWLS